MLTSLKRQFGFGVIESIIIVLILLILGTVVLAGYFAGKRDARDAQRVSDIVQIQKALKYYYEEFGEYPQASNNMAVGVNNSFSRFISKWPTPPTPADGNCADRYNTYTYEQLTSGESYQLTFCLGQDYNNLSAGVHVVTPSDVK